MEAGGASGAALERKRSEVYLTFSYQPHISNTSDNINIAPVECHATTMA